MPEESSSLHHAPPCELTGTLGAIIPQTNGLLPCETFALATAFGKWPPLKLMCGYAYAAVSALAGGKGRLSCEWKGYEAPEYGRDWAGGKPGRKCTGPNNKAFLRSCRNLQLFTPQVTYVCTSLCVGRILNKLPLFFFSLFDATNGSSAQPRPGTDLSF